MVIYNIGNCSIFAVEVMQKMGYKNIVSLKIGLRGWVDYELPLVDANE